MLLNLIQVICISAALGTNFNIKEKRKSPNRDVNQDNHVVDYNETINSSYAGTIVARNSINISNPNSQYEYYADSNHIKENLAATFSAMTIQGNLYRQYTFWKDTDDPNAPYYNAYQSNYNTATYNKYTEMLLVLAITPYNNNINVEGHYNIRININFDDYNIPETYNVENIRLNIKTYQSLEPNWAGLINRQDYATNIDDLVDDYTGASSAYTYNRTDQVINNITFGNNVLNNSVELQITPNNTNYVMIRTTLVADYIEDPYTNPNSPFNREYVYLTQYSTSVTTQTIANISISGRMLIQNGNTEIVDIPGLMFDILGMPFTFVSMAFNLTIFPGTPYQVNISNLILSLLAIIIFMWIINLIAKR